MTFVILGTEKFAFDRLVQKVDILARNNSIEGPIFIQLGSCKYIPKYCKWERFLSFAEMCKRIEASACIIAHAGAGTTLLCLQYGKKPILVPRQKKFNEHVDNHQVIFARKMQELGRVSVAYDVSYLAELIRMHGNTKEREISRKAELSELTQYINKLIDSWESSG